MIFCFEIFGEIKSRQPQDIWDTWNYNHFMSRKK